MNGGDFHLPRRRRELRLLIVLLVCGWLHRHLLQVRPLVLNHLSPRGVLRPPSAFSPNGGLGPRFGQRPPSPRGKKRPPTECDKAGENPAALPDWKGGGPEDPAERKTESQNKGPQARRGTAAAEANGDLKRHNPLHAGPPPSPPSFRLANVAGDKAVV